MREKTMSETIMRGLHPDYFMEKREKDKAKKRRRQRFEEIKILYPEYEADQ